MSARIISIASAKGGSGKTIITAALGHFLAAMGKRVLLIDTDAATNGLSLFYLNEIVAHRDNAQAGSSDSPTPAGIFDLARNHGRLSTVALDQGIAFLPATYRSVNTEDVSSEAFAEALRETLALEEGDNDFILLDAQAGSDSIAQVSMSSKVSSQVVLVSEYDPLSAAGVERLKSLFPNDLAYERTWILVNKMLPEFASSLGDFLQVARYLPPIPWNADVVRAYAQRSLALDLTYGNDYTLAVIAAAKGLLGPGMSEEITLWLDSRASALKAPIRRQLHDLETEANGLVIEQANRRRQETAIRFRRVGFIGVGMLLLSAIALAVTRSLGGPAVVAASVGVLLYALREEILGLSKGVGWEVRATDLDRQKRHIEERIRTLRALAESDPTELLESQTKIPRFKP